jgi:hypothetical protein
VNLEDYNCRSLEFDIFFSSDEFDKDAFSKEVDSDDTTEEYSWVFGSKQQPGKQHAHIEIEFSTSPKEPHHARLIYIRSSRHVADNRKRYMESCARWLFSFFKPETIDMFVQASFDFDKSYTPVIALPFPFVPVTGASRFLEGSSITGVGIDFPPNSKLDTVVIQHFETGIMVNITAIAEMRLKRFSAANELKKLSVSVGQLIVKTGEIK